MITQLADTGTVQPKEYRDGHARTIISGFCLPWRHLLPDLAVPPSCPSSFIRPGKLLFEAGDQVPGPGGVFVGAGADTFEVVEGREGVAQRIAGSAGLFEEKGDVTAGSAGLVGVAHGITVVDGLLVVMQSLTGGMGLAADVAELVMADGKGSGVVCGGQIEGLLVASQGCVEV
jgi:hypothetical protein